MLVQRMDVQCSESEKYAKQQTVARQKLETELKVPYRVRTDSGLGHRVCIQAAANFKTFSRAISDTEWAGKPVSIIFDRPGNFCFGTSHHMRPTGPGSSVFAFLPPSNIFSWLVPPLQHNRACNVGLII